MLKRKENLVSVSAEKQKMNGVKEKDVKPTNGMNVTRGKSLSDIKKRLGISHPKAETTKVTSESKTNGFDRTERKPSVGKLTFPGMINDATSGGTVSTGKAQLVKPNGKKVLNGSARQNSSSPKNIPKKDGVKSSFCYGAKDLGKQKDPKIAFKKDDVDKPTSTKPEIVTNPLSADQCKINGRKGSGMVLSKTDSSKTPKKINSVALDESKEKQKKDMVFRKSDAIKATTETVSHDIIDENKKRETKDPGNKKADSVKPLKKIPERINKSVVDDGSAKKKDIGVVYKTSCVGKPSHKPAESVKAAINDNNVTSGIKQRAKVLADSSTSDIRCVQQTVDAKIHNKLSKSSNSPTQEIPTKLKTPSRSQLDNNTQTVDMTPPGGEGALRHSSGAASTGDTVLQDDSDKVEPDNDPPILYRSECKVEYEPVAQKAEVKVFFRSGGLAQLEDARDEKMTDKIVELQAVSRGYLARQKAKKLKLQHLAVRCIQRNVQKFMAVREWTWWRLYTKVQPLLNVHRTEEELKAKEVELEQIKMKFDKLEKERNEYKQAADRLGTKLTEISVDFAEEHSTSNHATEMLETEAAERMRLERELKDIQVKYSALQRKQEMTEMDLMQARMIAASLDDADEDEVDGVDSVYRERYERSRRENDFQKKKLQQQHEEEIEKYEQQKKQYDRKLAEALEVNDELGRQVANQKRKVQRQNQEMQDVKLHLEEQVGRNADLEKKQRKFDNELQKVNSQMKDEKVLREKIQREKDEFATEKFTLEQEVKNVKVDFEIQTEKMERLDKELQELGSSGNKDDKEVLHLKRIKNELERKTQDQEEELDEQAGTIQQLEQAKLRLEMGQEKIRQQHAKELDEKEQELEEMRASTHKKIKTYEAQVEEEYEERQNIIKEKRELERKLKDLSEQTPSRDRDVEKRLRKDLRKTKALLQDAQRMLEKQKDGSGKNTVRQLRNQLEDSEYATTAAVKARKGVELELQELQHQLDSISKSKQDVENKCSNLSREKNDIQSRLDDNEEEMAEILKKYKALVQQQSTDYIKLEDQSKQVEEFLRENQQLKEQYTQLESQIEFLHSTTVDKENVVRLEAKIRELENRLAYEQTTRHLAEVQVERTKDQVEVLTQSKDNLENDGAKHNEVVKRLQREVRDAKEEYGELEVKYSEALQRKQDLQSKSELLETDYEQSQANLRLAFKRIADLQAVIEEGIDTGDDEDDSDNLDSDTDETDTESDDETDMILVNHRASRTSSVSSVPMRAEQASVGSEGDAGSSSAGRCPVDITDTSSQAASSPSETFRLERNISTSIETELDACSSLDMNSSTSVSGRFGAETETPDAADSSGSSAVVRKVYADGEYL